MLKKKHYWDQHEGYGYWDIDKTRKNFEKIATELYCQKVLKSGYRIITDSKMQKMGIDVITDQCTIDIKCRISISPCVGAPDQFRDLTRYWNQQQDVIFELEQRNSSGKPANGWALKKAPYQIDNRLPKQHKIVFVFLYIGYQDVEIEGYNQVVELDFADVKQMSQAYINNEYFRKLAQKKNYIKQLGRSSSKMPGSNISVKLGLLKYFYEDRVNNYDLI